MKKIFIGIIVVVVIGVGGIFAVRFSAHNTPVVLSDGQHLGFIRSFSEGMIYFDDAVWLTGRAGEDAAIRAGICTEQTRVDCLPNDYFIENVDTTAVPIALSADMTVTMQTWKMSETGDVADYPISASEFFILINNKGQHWNTLPYTITVHYGIVTDIREVYIP